MAHRVPRHAWPATPEYSTHLPRSILFALAAAVTSGDVAAPLPEEQEIDDRVPCPHCGRKFAALPAERHIAKCKDIRAKPKTIKRSDAAGPPLGRPAPRAEAAEGSSSGKAAKAPPAKAPPKAPPGKDPKLTAPPQKDQAGGSASSSGRASPLPLAGRDSPVPSLDFSRLGGSRPTSPRLSGGGFGPASPAASCPTPPPPPAAAHTAEPEAPSEASPPSELDQLHALGESKGGRHNARRPPVAMAKRRPAAAAAAAEPNAPQANGGWDASPTVKPPPGRKVKQSIVDAVGEKAADAAKPQPKPRANPPSPALRRSLSGTSSAGSSSSARSESSNGARPAKPAARKSSGYGQQPHSGSRTQSPAAAGSGSSSRNASPSSARSSTRSSTRSNLSSSQSRQESPKRTLQSSPGMRPPTVPRQRAAAATPTGSPASGRSRTPTTTSANNSRASSPSGQAATKPSAIAKAAKVGAVKQGRATVAARGSPAPPSPGRQPMAPRSASLENISSGSAALPTTVKKPVRRAPLAMPPSSKSAVATKAVADATVAHESHVGAVPFFKLTSDVPALAAAEESSNLRRQSSLQDMANECKSPTAFHVSSRWGVADAFENEGLSAAARHGAENRAPAAGATTNGGARQGAALFDRSHSTTTPLRRSGSYAAEAKENAGVGYQEVEVQRFGWRRNSFVSRANSPMLAR